MHTHYYVCLQFSLAFKNQLHTYVQICIYIITYHYVSLCIIHILLHIVIYHYISLYIIMYHYVFIMYHTYSLYIVIYSLHIITYCYIGDTSANWLQFALRLVRWLDVCVPFSAFLWGHVCVPRVLFLQRRGTFCSNWCYYASTNRKYKYWSDFENTLRSLPSILRIVSQYGLLDIVICRI